jgi:hypothetical protein
MYLVIHEDGLIESKSTVSEDFLACVQLGFIEIIRIKVLDIRKGEALLIAEIYEGDGIWKKI